MTKREQSWPTRSWKALGPIFLSQAIATSFLGIEKVTNQRKRPDILGQGAKKLSKKELRILKAVRATFEPGIVNICLRFFQRTIGQSWIHHSTKNLRHMHGMERLPSLATDESVLVVANHRSYLDILVLAGHLGADATFLSRHDVGDWPVVGRAARDTGVVFVDRDAPQHRARPRGAESSCPQSAGQPRRRSGRSGNAWRRR